MKFGSNFGIMGQSGGGAPVPPPPIPLYGNVTLTYTDAPGTYDFLELENGFEFELFGDGDQTTKPWISIPTDNEVPVGSSIEFSITIEQLSGENIMAYSFINFFSAAGIVSVPGTTNGTTLGQTSVKSKNIIIQFNETKTGRMRFTNLSFNIL